MKVVAKAEPPLDDRLTALLERVNDAARWCDARLHLPFVRESLRTETLRPKLLATGRAEAVERVVARRASAAAEEGRPPARDGRLLVHFPDRSLSDGAAEVETTGFFDVDNVPAWDTWVGYFADLSEANLEEYLLAWVPAPLELLVGRGIWANPEGCIRWLEESQTALFHRLRSEAPYLVRAK